MKILESVASICKLILAQLVKIAVAQAVAIVFAPIYIGIIWLALPHLAKGRDDLIWPVTGVLVLLALPVIYLINRLNAKVDDAMSSHQNAA
ncbi:hypothetical protein [Adhaeretor mobilis]|uniref:Uncharacterized protein n=1 Tax=Adhaeretor mobilis TaxID=1930276 RepID=A0A517N294_9BACT|nr:hypothetical protein [Adhaeretor mobilis]QDT01254.1 hypothetical protein HG15A2_45960 [Adhaeretor mobilis]